MNRLLTLALVSMLLCCGLFAQSPKEGERPTEDDSLPHTRADLNEFIKKQYPGMDPAGEHNFLVIKNYADKDKRFAYTRAMWRLLLYYIGPCQMGATMAKHFDALARGAAASEATFNVLYAVVTLHYPEGNANVIDAEKLLRKAIQQDAKFECAWYWLARIEFERLRVNQSTRRAVDEALDNALARPKFGEAMDLRVRLMLSLKPEDREGAKKILDQMFALEFDDPATFNDTLGFYRQCTTTPELIARIDSLIKDKRLTPRFEGQAHAMVAYVLKKEENLADALKRLDLALSLVKVEDDPASVIEWHAQSGDTWFKLAGMLVAANPSLQGDDRKRYEGFISAGQKSFELAVEYERVHLPLDIRGSIALGYAVGMTAVQVLQVEQAVKWLDSYLKRTVLSQKWRTRLEKVMLDLRGMETGDERARLIALKEILEKGEPVQLLDRLKQYEEAVYQNVIHFKSGESREFFISHLIKHQDREIAGLAALLLADGAIAANAASSQPEVIQQAADAIAERYELETELKTDGQAAFHVRLLTALKLFNKRNIDLRALKHLRKLVFESKDPDDLSEAFRNPILLFANKEWPLTVYKNSDDVPELRQTQVTLKKKVRAWLDAVIAELEKQTK